MSEYHLDEMIVKLGEDLAWDEYVHANRTVKAVKMPVDFLLETTLGFIPGKRGDYVIQIAKGVRLACSGQTFLKEYQACEKMSDRRRAVADRRKARGGNS